MSDKFHDLNEMLMRSMGRDFVTGMQRNFGFFAYVRRLPSNADRILFDLLFPEINIQYVLKDDPTYFNVTVQIN